LAPREAPSKSNSRDEVSQRHLRKIVAKALEVVKVNEALTP